MHVPSWKTEENMSDEEIIKTLQDSSDTEAVFTATREGCIGKVWQTIDSRGDYFDRKGFVVFMVEDQELLRIPLCSLPVTIGSGDKVDCRLEYEGISRVHCRMETIGNLIRICDTESKNGLWLNGCRIEADELCDGDEVSIGTLSLRVRRG